MKKIMFNDRYGLTQAVLEGRKTMTMRLVPRDFFTLQWDEKYDTLWYENDMGDFIDIRESGYARYKVGEVVAIAQSYESTCNQIDLEFMDLLVSVSELKNHKGWRTENHPQWEKLHCGLRLGWILRFPASSRRPNRGLCTRH